MRYLHFCAHEQFGPDDLLRQAVEAERAGFDGIGCSDHLQPWWEGGESGNAWVWLGAAAQATERVLFGTGVTPPGPRYHPALIAQAWASRYLTHMKRLRGIADAVARFWEPLEPLRQRRRLGPVLWQLPESFHRDDDLLAAALGELPRADHCFEFRHPSWFAAPVRELLAEHGASLAIGVDKRRPLPEARPCGEIAYLRLHYGHRGRGGNYSEASSAAEFVPPSRSLDKLLRAASGCRGCPLWKDATQTVFGAGPRKAALMLVGEQPGDREDIEGEPFVGPAGGVLAQALESAGIDAENVYLTNAVKHFKWRPRGKRRLHQTPRAGEVEACRPWLDAELKAVRPTGLMALGATAGKALFGPSVRVTRDRGRLIDSPLAPVAALTLHPSAILRLRDHDEREDALADLVDDLRLLASSVANRHGDSNPVSRLRRRGCRNAASDTAQVGLLNRGPRFLASIVLPFVAEQEITAEQLSPQI